jgi:septal ring factor EnvC (AmiA/AmiB activator)
MEYSFFNRIRDVLLLCALFFLVKTALDRTSSFLAEHKESIIHELDRNFIDQIYTAQRQLHFLQENLNTHTDELAEIQHKLASIEEKYKKNSPSLALLGPIGSAAIVIKEEQLQQQLLTTVNDLNKLVISINNPLDSFLPTSTINDGLAMNKQLLRTFATS